MLECDAATSVVRCRVRGRWNTLLAEEDQSWKVGFVGDRIQTLTIQGAVGDMATRGFRCRWRSSTTGRIGCGRPTREAAARLIPDPAARPFPMVPQYDPALADEISASIQLYLTQRPPGDEISVTADLVEFGDRLVGLISNMARADGHTYVIAGRFQTDTDLFFTP